MVREEALKVAKPISFNSEMVKAIQDNLKTVTRRYKSDIPYQVGDILYVREMWGYRYCWECEQQGCVDECDQQNCQFYNAPFGEYGCYVFPDEIDEPVDHQWHKASYMPKAAARLFLRVKVVSRERVKEITEEQATAEGFASREEFIDAFLKIYPNCTENDTVWVIAFERLEVIQ